MGAFGLAIDFASLQKLLAAGAHRDIFERALKPGCEHVTNLAAAVALRVIHHGGIAKAHMSGAGFGRDVKNLELSPAALGDPPHVVVEHFNADHAMMRGFLFAPEISGTMTRRPEDILQLFRAQRRLDGIVVVEKKMAWHQDHWQRIDRPAAGHVVDLDIDLRLAQDQAPTRCEED